MTIGTNPRRSKRVVRAMVLAVARADPMLYSYSLSSWVPFTRNLSVLTPSVYPG